MSYFFYFNVFMWFSVASGLFCLIHFVLLSSSLWVCFFPSLSYLIESTNSMISKYFLHHFISVHCVYPNAIRKCRAQYFYGHTFFFVFIDEKRQFQVFFEWKYVFRSHSCDIHRIISYCVLQITQNPFDYYVNSKQVQICRSPGQWIHLHRWHWFTFF